MPSFNRTPSSPRLLPSAWSVELDLSLARFTADAFERTPQDPLLGVFPYLYYACRMAPLLEVRRWVRRHLGLEVTEAQLKHAMRWPDRYWSHLWQTALKPAACPLARWSGWSLEDVLCDDDALADLRDELCDLWLGDLASTHRAIDQIEGALGVLARRWYALDSGTRTAAWRYLAVVVQVCQVDDGLTRSR